MTGRLALALTLPMLLVASCGDDGPDAADEPGSPTSVADVDYPEEGLDLVDRPELKGVYEQALQTYVDFERGRREAARQGKVGRLLSFNAVADVVDPYRDAIAAYAGDPYDGDVVVEFLDAKPRDLVLQIDVCIDATALEVPDSAPTLLGEATRSPQRIDVTNIEGPWRVTRVEPLDGSC